MRILQRLSRQDISRLTLSLGLVLIISALHYGTSTEHLEMHELFEHLYYIPVLLVAFWYGALAGIGFAMLTSAIYLVHILKDLAQYTLFDPLTHLLLYNLMALIVGVLSERSQRHLRHLQKASAELSEAYQELRDTSESLKRSERLAALGQLSAGIAHEIRNPLGSIKGAVDILSSEIPEGHPKEEFVGIVREEVSRINTLIDSFLRFARPPEPRTQNVRVSDLISSAVRLVKGHASEKNVEISCSGDDHTIRVDIDQLRQVLLNLLLNSLEAIPNQGRIRIEFEQHNPSGETVLEISDDGGGFDGEDLDSIFDPFYTTKPSGTGLGLSISDQLVRNHGGQLKVRRNPENGLTFSILLPSTSKPALSHAI